MTFPSLETERLLLTEISDDDIADIYYLFANPTVVEFYDLETFHDQVQASKLINLFRSRYEEKLGIRWAIRLKMSGQLIGTCGFNSWNERMHNAVIGYDLHSDFWRQGYSTEAVRAIIVAAFSGELPCGKLHRIQADTVPGNYASESLLRRLDFKEEGLRREAGFWKGRFHDLKCFGLLESEFNLNNPYPNK
ncbi:GNAT family protein [Aliiglaciecola sp. CAU 1673]|uniref:GNAT family N-acetyltransferase n=1 Tax=Aliiglaciecola sp. CAU 1673 TaxID=3032595 RepID=UPI0023DABA19|nr:GNAT family protein [Aliiglaciecola sp. CAU 1673]MDF2178892.1 GNAT family protein [Aliiglaciecola sp. CAU 1673]